MSHLTLRPLLACLVAAGLLLAAVGGPKLLATEVLPDADAPRVDPILLDPSLDPLPAPKPLLAGPESELAWVDEILAESPNQDDPFATVDACMAQDMAGGDGPADDTPGASLAISQNGELVYAKGYGLREAGGQTAVDTETRFRIGSTTKQLTSAALLQRVEAGQLDMDAPITEALPDLSLAPPYQASAITPHHLLTHSSGIPDQLWVLDPALSLADWTAFAAPRYQLTSPPGSFWNYSNPNFNLAGLIVEQLSGKPYYDYMAEEVFARAAMTRTTFYSEEVEASGNYALGLDGGSIVPLDQWDIPGLAPAGTAFSTPTDMVRWANLLMDGGGEVLSEASAQAMQQAQVPIEITGWDDYGYGIFVTAMRDVENPDQAVTVYDHGGNIPGYSSQLFWVPERGFAVSILANTIRSLSGAARCALQVVAGVQPQSAAGLGTSPEEWGPYEGTYAMANTAQWPFTAQVRLVSDTLRLDYSDIGRSPFVGRDYRMVNALRETFLLDADNDGQPEPTQAFTFLRDREGGERVRWLRDRLVVGHRIGQFPDRVALQGAGCAPIDFTADRALDDLSVQATGLSTWTAELDLPLIQDDPQDPSSAGYKRDIHIEGGADLFWVGIAADAGSSIASYLMRDMDGDGDFSFPAELAVAGQALQANMQVLYPTQTLPAGDYQLWIHGVQASGEDASLQILPLTSEGDRLRLEDPPPSSVAEGESHSLRVCADEVSDLEEPALGTVTFRYGQPPRLVRVMVDWAPAEAPPGIYLPWLANRAGQDSWHR